ncbi:MAG: hypothetical protein IJM70_02885, partial [Prevotella sp.]|nr:hypothetical protein [Prevotella sp.]
MHIIVSKEIENVCPNFVGAAVEAQVVNIAGLPVYRDAQGGVGTPTSDNERTKMTLQTTHLVVLINGYDGQEE